MPPYIVFSDATLVAIVQARPTSVAALGAVSGVGPQKQQRYGAAVVAIVGGTDPDDAPLFDL